jgi:LacI family transcriptional regulator
MARHSRRRVAIVLNLAHALKRHQEIFSGAYRYALQRGWHVDAMPFTRQISTAGRERLRYDGIIARADARLGAFAKAARVPLVNVWYSSPVRDAQLVSSDQARVGAMAADHLRARGFRRFAFAGYGRVRASVDAERAFVAALGDAVSYDRFATSLNFSEAPTLFARFERSLATWLTGLRRPVGLFAADDGLARHIVNAATVCGINVPGELAIVGTFNDEPYCLLAEPTITSIDCGLDRVGYRAAKVLEDLMEGRPSAGSPVLLPPKELIPRDSTDVFATDDEMVTKALRFMSDNCHKPINVGEVVEKLRVCGRTLARRFRKERGCRPIDELTRMRITRAKRLLVEDDTSIRAVAEQCGFATGSQFIAAFRRIENTTPGKFRSRA